MPGPKKELAINLGEFIELFNSWFDIMNSFTIQTNLRKKPYINMPEQNDISAKNLFEDLKREYDIKYLLTHRLNQDVLENFFSQVKQLLRVVHLIAVK